MLIRADARQLPLQDGCVDCCVTSPPYWGLRDYGTAGQIGLEASPADYVAALLEVFREVWRVLKVEGTCWLNLGDSYATGAGKVGECPGGGEQGERWKGQRNDANGRGTSARCDGRGGHVYYGPMTQPNRLLIAGLKSKDLCMIPARVALALQAEGWYLRSDVIWSKPNPMPESVTDRPTKAHEYLFLLSKSERYYYDADAIAEALSEESIGRYARVEKNHEVYDPARHKHGDSTMHNAPMQVLTRAAAGVVARGTRNKRTVWTIPTLPYSGAHFATMPEALVEPCILAGCKIGGLVLDPFVGSGTVVSVAERLGRRGVGVDLSYQDLARERTAQRGLRFTDARV